MSRGRPFPKGVSPNPGGRPRELRDLKELARGHTAEAVAALVQVAVYGKNERARVAASVALLDRGYGRPQQSVDIAVANPLSRMSDAELDARIEELRKDRMELAEPADALLVRGQ